MPEKALDNVAAAYDRADRLQSNGGVASAIAARAAADNLAAAWADAYPQAAAARKAARAAEAESRQSTIRSSDGYKAAIGGRD